MVKTQRLGHSLTWQDTRVVKIRPALDLLYARHEKAFLRSRKIQPHLLNNTSKMIVCLAHAGTLEGIVSRAVPWVVLLGASSDCSENPKAALLVQLKLGISNLAAGLRS